VNNTDFENYLDSIGAQWAHLGATDYAVTLNNAQLRRSEAIQGNWLP
jgi:hypothetical protein